MKIVTLVLIGMFAASAVAQEPKAEKLSATEVIAVNEVAVEINRASQDAGNVVADIQKAHPGYTFDFRSGQLVKVVPILKPEAQPKTETRTKTAPETPLPQK